MLDSFGIGATDDAGRFGDVGANTLGSIAKYRAAEGREPLQLPNLASLGLLHAAKASAGEFPAGTDPEVEIVGAYGFARELSSGKDTPSGHWEMAGVPVLFEWGYFRKDKDTFPQELLDALIERAELPGVLGNCHSSGTTIIVELGEEHMRTGKPIVYTSADSVFQIACHEESFGLERLYKLSEIARKLVDDYNIGRVIARPFVGTDKNNFVRTGNRRDLTVLPPSPTSMRTRASAKKSRPPGIPRCSMRRFRRLPPHRTGPSYLPTLSISTCSTGIGEISRATQRRSNISTAGCRNCSTRCKPTTC
jgi:phosphopentomutase